jgi:hypothetical protein
MKGVNAMKTIVLRDKAASYCCESSNTFPVTELLTKGLRKIQKVNKSASYCCESSNSIDAKTFLAIE